MCKIKDLDRNEVYDLTEIKKDAVKFDMLKEWLKENDNWNSDNLLGLDDTLDLFYSMEFRGWYHDGELKSTKCALTLFELDITDYQVDCSELSEVEINNLVSIIENNGYVLWKVENPLSTNKFHWFKCFESGFLMSTKCEDKTTITYDKFIELFGEKPIDWIQSDFGKYKLTEQGLVFHDDFDLELYKELGGLSNKKSIEQAKPSQYQIGIDTFTRAESNMTKDEILACVRFNIDKYTWRKKDQDKQDLEKIISYAQWGLKQLNK